MCIQAAMCLAVVGFAGLGSSLSAQEFESPGARNSAVDPVVQRNVEDWIFQGKGVVDDWSHHHLVFSSPGTEEDAVRNGTYEHWLKVVNNPRYTMQQIKRGGGVKAVADAEAFAASTASAEVTATTSRGRGPGMQGPSPLKKDWSMDLGSTAKVAANAYPAKFSFYPTNNVPACASAAQPDFVVYNTGVAGSATQASIVAYDNLYVAPTCTSGSVPTLYWAYNTGATPIPNSVSLSEDGKQVAFVEDPSSGTAAATLVLLKWAANTTGRTVTGSLSASSPEVTITSGTFTQADVGAQITGTNIPAGDTIASVISGTTANLTTAPTAHASETLTIVAEAVATPGVPPTVSNAAYRLCTAPCMTTFTLTNADTYSAPYVDYIDDVLYVGDDGPSGGAGVLHKFTGVFNGTPTAGTSVNVSTTSDAPLGSPVYDFSSSKVFVGGVGDGQLYAVTSTGTVTTSSQLGYSSKDIADAPLVDSAAAMVYVFVAADANSGSSAGVFRFPTSSVTGAGTEAKVGTGRTSAALYDGTFDNQYYTSASGASPTGNLYVCGDPSGDATLYQIKIISNAFGTITAGPVFTTGRTACSPVTEIYNSNASIGSNPGGPFDWIYLSAEASGSPSGCSVGGCVVNYIVTSWTASTPYTVGQEILDTHLNIQKVTTAGTSGTIQPTWATSGTTTDHTGGALIWTEQGTMAAVGSTATAEAGGTSGIVVDNTSNSTGASQIYFSTLASGTCSTSGGTGGCAVQTSQSAP
jgi:hypothetical protein